MTVRVVSAPQLLREGRLTGPGAVLVQDGVIAAVLDERPPSGPDHDELATGILTAGLVDLQVNGGYGVDLATATPDQWHDLAAALPGTGVTAFLPTFVTAPLPDLVEALERTAAARDALAGTPTAQVLGAHLEGPFLSPLHAGAHDPELMVEPSPQRLDELLATPAAGRVLRMVTLAPELPDALDAVRRLVADGVVVSLGHSDATAAQTAAAAEAGARMVTHLFNAQRGLWHREPGLPGQALVDQRLTLGVIADLEHLDAAILQLVLRAAPGRVALVTDAVAAAGMAPGSHQLGGRPVVVEPGSSAPRRPDGTLAGSVLQLDAAVRNVVALGTPVAAALDAASRVPADVLGRYDIGRLAAGARADLVWWDQDLLPVRTWVGGVRRVTRSESP